MKIAGRYFLSWLPQNFFILKSLGALFHAPFSLSWSVSVALSDQWVSQSTPLWYGMLTASHSILSLRFASTYLIYTWARRAL